MSTVYYADITSSGLILNHTVSKVLQTAVNQTINRWLLNHGHKENTLESRYNGYTLHITNHTIGANPPEGKSLPAQDFGKLSVTPTFFLPPSTLTLLAEGVVSDTYDPKSSLEFVLGTEQEVLIWRENLATILKAAKEEIQRKLPHI